MTRYRLLSLASIASTILCVSVAAVAIHRGVHYVPEAERMWQWQRGVDAATQRNHSLVDEGDSDYRHLDRDSSQFFVHEMDAAYEAEHWLYVVLPRRIVLGLAVLPSIWLVVAWRRRARHPVPRWPAVEILRLLVHLLTPLAALSLLLAILTAGLWVKAQFMQDGFSYCWLADRHRITRWSAVGLNLDRSDLVLHVSFAGPEIWIDERAKMDLTPYERSMSQIYVRLYGFTRSRDATIGFNVTTPEHRFLGLSYISEVQPATTLNPNWFSDRAFGMSYWLLDLIFVFFPVVWFGLVRRRHQNKPNCCPQCDYDLTGNISGVCPECGQELSEVQRA